MALSSSLPLSRLLGSMVPMSFSVGHFRAALRAIHPFLFAPGEVVQGQELVTTIETKGTGAGSVKAKVVIANCGTV